MSRFRFAQVDVFTAERFKGNPLAVVVGADGLDDVQMAAFANWTNLAETTFLLAPTTPQADYRVRIFTTQRELPFAGHPTLGSCQVWLSHGGVPCGDVVVQECGAGLVRVRRDGERLAFAAPPLLRTGAVDADDLARIVRGLGLTRQDVVASQWIDNGPGWVAVMLSSRDQLLAIKPDYAALAGYVVGVVAPCAPGEAAGARFEVRAFIAGEGAAEDPVTGSLNAGLAQWLIGAGLAPDAYEASQGTALGRAGRVHVQQLGDDIWIGGEVAACIEGEVEI